MHIAPAFKAFLTFLKGNLKRGRRRDEWIRRVHPSASDGRVSEKFAPAGTGSSREDDVAAELSALAQGVAFSPGH